MDSIGVSDPFPLNGFSSFDERLDMPFFSEIVAEYVRSVVTMVLER